MKEINFIQTNSPEKKQMVQRWITITVLLITAFLLALTLFALFEWYRYRTLTQEKKALTGQLNAYNALIQEYRDTQDILHSNHTKLSKLDKYQQSKNKRINALDTLQSLCNQTPISYLSLHKKEFELHVSCKQPHEIMQLINRLKEKQFKNVQLVSLHDENETLSGWIKGELI